MPRLFLEWPVLSTYRLVPYVAYFSDVGSYSLHREVKASISLFQALWVMSMYIPLAKSRSHQ